MTLSLFRSFCPKIFSYFSLYIIFNHIMWKNERETKSNKDFDFLLQCHNFVKFGLVLIFILKVYRKISCLIFLRKNIFNSLLEICFWKACTFSSSERFFCCKSRNYFQIHLSGIMNYWGSILTLYIRWGAFSLVCVLSVFFSFLFFFFSYRYFPWQPLTIHKMGRERKGLFCLFSTSIR